MNTGPQNGDKGRRPSNERGPGDASSLSRYGWIGWVILTAIVALTTAECAQIVGVLLVFALMVGPAAAAQRLTRTVATGTLLSALLALFEAWLGLTLAFYTDWPSSFWITALSSAVYLFTGIPRLVGDRNPRSRAGR